MIIRWTPDKRVLLKKLFQDGLSDKEIAKIVGVSAASIAGKRNLMGLKRDRRRGDTEWTDEKIEFIKSLHAKKHTMRKIAEYYTDKFKERVTKNAIIGKLHREGVTQQTIAIVQRVHNKPLNKAFLATKEGGILLLDATYNQCRYPFSTGAKMRVCGAKNVSGCSYCQEHKELCIAPIREKKATDAAKAKHKERFFNENTVI
jgi:hypothetical protein